MSNSAGQASTSEALATDHTVVAVVVTYEPDLPSLQRLLDELQTQVSGIVVADNSARPYAITATASTELLRMPSNVGLGAAQNAGIRAALARGCGFVLLLDQDSLPAANMVQALIEAYHDATQAGYRVAAVGPRVIDPDGHDDGFVRFRNGRYEAVPVGPRDPWIDCDMLIASGSLVPKEALSEVGDMAEQLFIDKVDTEWCLRAASHGYRLIGAPRAMLHHRLGEHAARVWLFRWRELRAHKPFRYYYMVRNAVLLRRLPHSTPAWRRADLRQLLSIILYFGLLLPQRGAALRMMLRGLVDGWRNISGPMR